MKQSSQSRSDSRFETSESLQETLNTRNLENMKRTTALQCSEDKSDKSNEIPEENSEDSESIFSSIGDLLDFECESSKTKNLSSEVVASPVKSVNEEESCDASFGCIPDSSDRVLLAESAGTKLGDKLGKRSFYFMRESFSFRASIRLSFCVFIKGAEVVELHPASQISINEVVRSEPWDGNASPCKVCGIISVYLMTLCFGSVVLLSFLRLFS